jgi:hypothetical protein
MDVSSSTISTLSNSSPTVRRQISQLNAPDDDIVDPREVDKVLSELAGMTGRWSLFKKFLAERLRVRPYHCPFTPLLYEFIVAASARMTI